MSKSSCSERKGVGIGQQYHRKDKSSVGLSADRNTNNLSPVLFPEKLNYKINWKHLFWIIPITLILGLCLFSIGEHELMGHYYLYNCIYSNAQDNGFPQNQVMIEKVQQECICFRNFNYTKPPQGCLDDGFVGGKQQ